MQTIELNNVRKSYDKFVAVNDLSFSIEQGRVFGLLGPNGAGKTSTIRMMIGITVPDSGTDPALRQAVSTRKSLQRVGYLPEERGLYKKMKVIDQLVFLGELHGLDAGDAPASARIDWCERLEIADWPCRRRSKSSPRACSRRSSSSPRCCTSPTDHHGRALLRPRSGERHAAERRLLELKKQGKTILFSTHRMDQVEKLCDPSA